MAQRRWFSISPLLPLSWSRFLISALFPLVPILDFVCFPSLVPTLDFAYVPLPRFSYFQFHLCFHFTGPDSRFRFFSSSLIFWFRLCSQSLIPILSFASVPIHWSFFLLFLFPDSHSRFVSSRSSMVPILYFVCFPSLFPILNFATVSFPDPHFQFCLCTLALIFNSRIRSLLLFPGSDLIIRFEFSNFALTGGWISASRYFQSFHPNYPIL